MQRVHVYDDWRLLVLEKGAKGQRSVRHATWQSCGTDSTIGLPSVALKGCTCHTWADSPLQRWCRHCLLRAPLRRPLRHPSAVFRGCILLEPASRVNCAVLHAARQLSQARVPSSPVFLHRLDGFAATHAQLCEATDFPRLNHVVCVCVLVGLCGYAHATSCKRLVANDSLLD
jgi:hypothetical protein